MQRIVEVLIIVIAASSVAIADILIKKSALHATSFSSALTNPLLILASCLYILQIILFSFVFYKKWELGAVGLLQMVLYALIVVSVGVLYFHERLTPVHGFGMALALVAVILINI